MVPRHKQMSLFHLHRHHDPSAPAVDPQSGLPTTSAELPADRAQEFRAARQASDQFLWRFMGWAVALGLAAAAVIVLPGHPILGATFVGLGLVVLISSMAFRRFLRAAAADEARRRSTDEPADAVEPTSPQAADEVVSPEPQSQHVIVGQGAEPVAARKRARHSTAA